MKFRYARYGNAIRPVIPIKLKNGSEEIIYEALVDSGADMCIFHAEIGQAIGIDIKKGEMKEVFGIGGKASIYYWHKNIKIEVGGWEYTIEAGFMPDVAGRVMQYGVLGQVGFFSNFIIKFDYEKEEVEVKQRTKKL